MELTPARRNFSAFAVILVGLAGRAGIDKILALRDGPDLVALWAQLQSVADLVGGVALAGIGPGLTVLVAQTQEVQGDRNLLRSALRLGFGISVLALLLILLSAPTITGWFTGGKVSPGLVALAAVVGCVAVFPGLLSAYWLGHHQQDRILLLALATMLPLIAAALLAGVEGLLRNALLVQCAVALTIAIALIVRLHGRWGESGAGEGRELAQRRLARYLPVGIAIGILSPASVLAVRGILSDALSWSDAGFMQALWRTSEWVTGSAAGVLSLLFLPRLSAACGSKFFLREVARAAALVLIPSAVLLALIFLNQTAMLAALYDAKFVVSDSAAALFMLGDWVRIASWVFLYALFAMRRAALIIAGEFFSLPLYALLLHVCSDGMTLERAGFLYLLSYISYLAFNAAAVLYSPRPRLAA